MKWGLIGCGLVWLAGCSDSQEGEPAPEDREVPEVSPPAQGAFRATIAPASPTPAGKGCPIGSSLTIDLPPVAKPSEQLDDEIHRHTLIDGEGRAEVTCSVQEGANGSFTFSGTLVQGSRSFAVTSGLLDDTSMGTARVTLSDSTALFGSLSAPSATCTVEAAKSPGSYYQVGPGRIWARFSCALGGAGAERLLQGRGLLRARELRRLVQRMRDRDNFFAGAALGPKQADAGA